MFGKISLRILLTGIRPNYLLIVLKVCQIKFLVQKVAFCQLTVKIHVKDLSLAAAVAVAAAFISLGIYIRLVDLQTLAKTRFSIGLKFRQTCTIWRAGGGEMVDGVGSYKRRKARS